MCDKCVRVDKEYDRNSNSDFQLRAINFMSYVQSQIRGATFEFRFKRKCIEISTCIHSKYDAIRGIIITDYLKFTNYHITQLFHNFQLSEQRFQISKTFHHMIFCTIYICSMYIRTETHSFHTSN